MGATISFFLFMALIFLGSANFALFSPHEIHLAKEFDTSILAIDFIMFSFFAVSAFFLPLWGFLCDKAGRGGRRKLLFIGTAFWSISSLIIYFAPSYSFLLAARIISAVGIVVIYPVSFSMMADYSSPEKRGKALAIIPIFIALGAGMGLILSSAFGEFAWRPPFLVLGVSGLLINVFAFIGLCEPERGASEPELREVILAGKIYIHKINMQKFIKNLSIRTNQWIYLAGVIWALPIGIFSYKFMPYLEIYGFRPGIKTAVTLLIGSGVVFGYLAGGFAGDWAKKKRIKRIYICVLSLFLAVIFFSASWSVPQSEALWSFNTILFIFFAFFGAALAFFNVPNVYALMAEVNEPETRGMFFSIFNALGYLAMGVGVLASGINAKATLDSYRGALFLGTLVWLLTILFWLPIFRTIKKDAERLREIMAQRAKEMA